MTVIKSFQCDICFSPCTTSGSATILLVKKAVGGAAYGIVSRVPSLRDTMPEGDQMVRHICSTCVDIISCKTPPAPYVPAAYPEPWATAADMEEETNGQTD